MFTDHKKIGDFKTMEMKKEVNEKVEQPNFSVENIREKDQHIIGQVIWYGRTSLRDQNNMYNIR